MKLKRFNKLLSLLIVLSILISPVLGIFSSGVYGEVEEGEEILEAEIKEIDIEEEVTVEVEEGEAEETKTNEEVDDNILTLTPKEHSDGAEEGILDGIEEVDEETKIKEALDKVYKTFSVHGSANPIPFPYGDGEGQYKNAVNYIKDQLKELVPEYDVEFIYSNTLAGGVSFSGVLKQETMDKLGNITPVYNESPTKPAFMGVKFKIGEVETEKTFLLYFSVDPIDVTNQEMVDKEASAITFNEIKGRNQSEEYITGSLGKTTTSGVGALNTTPELYKTDIKIEWTTEHISGNNNALSLDSSNKTTVIRPNVGQGDAKFILIATVSHRTDNSAITQLKFNLTVPEFKGYKVPFRITPSDAELKITDSYYNRDVDAEYINIEEDGSLRVVTLHGSSTDSSQSYAYELSKEGYITQKGSVSVSNEVLEEINLKLEESSSNDSKLKSLEITNPASGAASIIKPMEEFKSEEMSYTMSVGDIPSITIRPTVIAEGATIVVNAATSKSNSQLKNYSVRSGSTRICYLFDGENIITITVRVPDSSTQDIKEESYTLTVTKDSGISYPLKDIKIEAYDSLNKGKNNPARPEEEVLSPIVDAGGIADKYTYYVNAYRDKVTITPEVNNKDKIEFIKVNEKLIEGTSEDINLQYGNNVIRIEVKEIGTGEPYIYNINVRRKYPAVVNSYSADGNQGKLTGWTGQVNFASDSTEAKMVFDIPEDAYVSIDGVDGKYKNGEVVEVPVGDAGHQITTIRVNREYIEDGKTFIDSHAYVIGLYRLASTSPTAVENYLPAPGQFVNQSSFMDPSRTLRPNPNMVTLGAFGGSIVYRFDEPIKNDPKNPYGIDFIVHGNVFRNNDGSSASGAAEPAAVMVSKDGMNWYELAGSLYYDAGTRHNIQVEYTNPDTLFSKAKSVYWKDNEGNEGWIAANSSHNQPYYPNPENYSQYNLKSNIGYNASYTKSSVKFTGTILKGSNSPAFGYGDSHANDDNFSSKAVNPYLERHYLNINGDGMDLSWAVDSDGKPINIDEAKYIKIYNPNLHIGGSTGEISPEIAFVQKAEGESGEVGVTKDLESISINGKNLELEPGKYEYIMDIDGMSSFVAKVETTEDTNIWINDNFVSPGKDSPHILAGDRFRIVAQQGKKEPVMYLINLANVADEDDNAEVDKITILPGDIIATRNGNTFSALVDSGTSNALIKAAPLSEMSQVYIDSEQVYKERNWQSTQSVKLAPGETKLVSIEVVSKNGTKESFALNITRRDIKDEGNNGDNDIGGSNKYIEVSFRLIGDTSQGVLISRESYSIPVGSTVKYVTDKALANHGIPFITNSAGTYIESINGLAEFDNGPNSGWMYTINGTHRGVDGYASQVLKQGDEIEWHYTDDYTKEEGSEDFSDNNTGDNSLGDKGSVDSDTPPIKKDEILDEEEKDIIEKLNKKYKDADSISSWALSSIKRATELGFVQGDNGKFNPKSNITRAEFTKIIVSILELEIEDSKEITFSDVEESDWYYSYVNTAYKAGIIEGYENLFNPNDNITREQMAAIIVRALGLKREKSDGIIKDIDKVSNWAKEDVETVVALGLMIGDNGNFHPQGNATREMATVLSIRGYDYKNNDKFKTK